MTATERRLLQTWLQMNHVSFRMNGQSMSLVSLLVFFILWIPSSRCAVNLTYVFSHVTNASIQTFLRSDGLILANSSAVTRLPSTGLDLINSVQTLLSSTDIQSIVFNWDTGDCSLPTALALNNSSINVVSPICFTETPSVSNLLQLTVTSEQLADAAGVFMTQYSLIYFSILISNSSDFYWKFAQGFSTSLAKKSFILEQFLFVSNFSTSSPTSLRSKGELRHKRSFFDRNQTSKNRLKRFTRAF